MKRTVTLGLALLIVLGVGGTALARTGGERPISVTAGNLRLTVDGAVTPTALPRTEPAPISFHAEGSLASLDGSPLPPLEQIVLDSSSNAGVDAVGFPACGFAKLQATSTAAAIKACPEAIVGRGKAGVEV